MEGIFIIFEGIEENGKSTQLYMLNKWGTNHDYDVVATRESGGTKIVEKIREFLHSGSKNDVFSSHTELMLFEESRVQHMEEIIFQCSIKTRLSCSIGSSIPLLCIMGLQELSIRTSYIY